MGFLKKLFSPPRLQYESAQISVDVIRRIRMDLGQDGLDSLSALHATNDEFIGTLLGIIDYLASQRGEPTKQSFPLAVKELFGKNAELAFATIRAGSQRPELMNSMQNIQMKLGNAHSPEESGRVLKSLEKFF